MKIEMRPLTSEERTTLANIDRPKFSAIESSGLLMLASLAVSGLTCRGLIALFPMLGNKWLILYVPLFLAVFAGGWWHRIRKSREKSDSEFAQDLKAGNAEVCVAYIRKAMQMDEFEDEGLGFYLETVEGKTLFLQGQYLYDLKEFPSTQIEVVRGPKSRIVFDVKCLGSPLKVMKKLPAFTPKDHELGRAHYDGDLLDQSLDEITRRT